MSGKGPRLGNDPFQRGAASREPAPAAEAESQAKAEAPVDEATGKKSAPPAAKAKKAAKSKQRPAAPRKSTAKKQQPASNPATATSNRKPTAGKPAATKKPSAKRQPASSKSRPARQPSTPPPPTPKRAGAKTTRAPEPSRVRAHAASPAPTGTVHPFPTPAPDPATDDATLPPWLRAATTAYTGPDAFDADDDATARAEPTPPDAGSLDEAVRAAGLGGTAALMESSEEPPRAVSGLERLLRSLLGPNLASEVQEAIAEVAEVARKAVVGSSASRRSEMIGRRAENYDEFGLDHAFETRVRPFFQALFERYFRVEVKGIEQVPDAGRCMLVCNHSGALPYDGTMVKTAVELRHPSPRPVRPLVEDFVYHFPFLGTFINRYGGVRACPENAERLLDHDALVAVFPEGLKGLGKLYRQRYQLQRFGRGGFVKLALRTGTPVVPVAIVGAEEIHPLLAKITFLVRPLGIPYLPITPTFPLLGPLGLLPLPSKWTIVFGEPVDLSRYGPDAADDRILVNRLAESIRSRIQTMVDDVLETRRGVFRG